MNAITTVQPSTTQANDCSNAIPARSNVLALPTRHTHRERDFGVGYGNSSGYASNRQYASNWAPPRFKFA